MLNHKIRYFLLLLCIWGAHVSLLAQVSVHATMDTTEIYIGEQVNITLQVAADTKKMVRWPHFSQGELLPGVEVIHESTVDTTLLNNGTRYSLTRRYTITSFLDSLYYLPPLSVQIGQQTYPSKSLALKVHTMAVDTLHPQKFFGVKDILRPVFLWSDWQGVFLLSLLLLILIGGTIWLRMYQYARQRLSYTTRRVIITPPHQQALTQIAQIKASHKDNQSPKEYYTALTGVLRTYIAERFHFNALEMTTAEIIEHLVQTSQSDQLQALRTLLQTADFVKFAKHSTMLSEDDQNLIRAIDFVNTTKTDEKTHIVLQREDISMKKRRRKRWFFRIALCLAILVSLTVAALLGYELYKLI